MLSILFWLALWQAGAMALNKSIILVTPVAAVKRLFELIPQADFRRTVLNSFLRIGGGFMLALIMGTVLAALSGAGQAGRDIFADILSNYPGDDRIYDLLVERFAMREEKRALFASYLAKLGDDRAIPMLKEAAQSPDINYLDYVEVVNAIEELGGERPPEREFSGDPYYESLRRV